MVALGPLRLVLWPLGLVRAPMNLIFIAVGIRTRRHYTLPVAGLDESNAEAILFALRRAAETPEVRKGDSLCSPSQCTDSLATLLYSRVGATCERSSA